MNKVDTFLFIASPILFFLINGFFFILHHANGFDILVSILQILSNIMIGVVIGVHLGAWAQKKDDNNKNDKNMIE